MKPWREVAVPHQDVLEGTFQQSEFAADIGAVRDGRATREYQDPVAFFDRTFITEGMRLLLTQVAQRLNGAGGEPVIQLQTAFGGGKTHTMLAVYHLSTHQGSLQELAGIPPLLDQARIMEVPRAKVAVLNGTEHAPGQPWKHGSLTVRTLWGELAWQLGGAEGYAAVAEADASGTSPGKGLLRELLQKYSPCIVLIDELVAYVRQFPDGVALSGGTYDSNLSFVQALTEAAKLVPNAVILASLPESEIEAGSSRGVTALRALEKTFGRVQALWKPVATEEGFEIVRRRLFEPIRDESARDEVCQAFFKLYADEGGRVPSETHESRYLQRLRLAYPIHPEVFDRLYEDWATLETFQRTRGVLKLMARVIYKLWKDQNKDLMLMPGSLPLSDGGSRNELTYYLQQGWDPVIERDIDGDRSEATELDTKETRFGMVHAARRVARTVFLASAPAAGGAKPGTRGIDRGRVLLGCLQPGQASSLYSDALNRLTDRLHYLNASGDKAQDSTRYWFDTRANLRREMEDRKARFDERNEVKGRIAEVVTKMAGAKGGLFDGTHVFTPHADVPDDGALRLVVLDPTRPYNKQDPKTAADAVVEMVRSNGTKPRFKGNRLVFVAPDSGALGRLRDAVRTALAWGSIVDDIGSGRLNIDRLQEAQAKKEQAAADAVATRAARDCYKWVLCPMMHAATDKEVVVEAFVMNTTSEASFTHELERVCTENELVISAWSPIHLRTKLRDLYWKDGKTSVRALAVWEDMAKYLYMPRLKTQAVFDQAVKAGMSSKDFFATAFGEVDGKYEGFKFGDGATQIDDTLLLIEPEAATAWLAAKMATPAPTGTRVAGPGGIVPIDTDAHYTGGPKGPVTPTAPPAAAKARTFIGAVDVSAATARMKLVTLAEEIIEVLAADPNATVKVTLEINAEFANGAPDHIKRAISENAATLGFKTKDWE